MTALKLVLHAVSDVSLFVGCVDQFQSQDPFRNIVCVEGLFGYDPSITCVGHIELSCVSEYDSSVNFATKQNLGKLCERCKFLLGVKQVYSRLEVLDVAKLV